MPLGQAFATFFFWAEHNTYNITYANGNFRSVRSTMYWFSSIVWCTVYLFFF